MVGSFVAIGPLFSQQPPAPAAASPPGRILSVEGAVRLYRAPSGPWLTATQNMTVAYGDRIATDEKGRVTMRLADLSVLRVPGSTILELEPTRRERTRGWLKVLAGWLYLNNRDAAEDILLETPTASCAVQGTEFVLAVEPEGATRVQVIDGKVEVARTRRANPRLWRTTSTRRQWSF